MQRNGERYQFLKWGSQAFDNFQVVPPGTGICHQVNLEYICAVRVDQRGREWRDDRLSGYARRDRQPHNHGQWPWRPWLGRWRHRSRSGNARPAGQHADPRSRRIPPRRAAQGGHHRDRPGADRHPDASPEGRRRPLRRIFRSGPRYTHARRPRDDRQHGAGIWRHLRLLPDRPAHARLSRTDRPRRRPDRTGQGLCEAQGLWRDSVHSGAAIHRHAASST